MSKRTNSKKSWLKSNFIWTFTTYFTEGFPYIIIRTVSSVFFRDMKVSLESIGLTSLFGLPWILKFLWGPQVDKYSSKRRWLLATQSLLFIMMLAAAVFAPLSFSVQAIAILFFLGSIVAATNDIAIDGYYMEALDKDGQAKFVGYRVMAYRIAMMAGTMVIVTLGTTISWFTAFFFAAILFGVFLAYHFLFLEEAGNQGLPIKKLLPRAFKFKNGLFILAIAGSIMGIRFFAQSDYYALLKTRFLLLNRLNFAHWVMILLLVVLALVGLFRNRIKKFFIKDPDSYYGKAFVMFMDRPKISTILAFILMLRIGEWTLANMVAPFIVDLGIKKHYGWISGFVGLPMAIAGALLGGWMISRYSLKKVIWPFILLQNVTNVVYMMLAIHLSSYLILNTGAEEPAFLGVLNLIYVAGVHGFDQFAGGLGNAVLMTYLMRICHKDFKAAHYAIGSGLMNVSAPFAGVLSGIIAGWLGYAWLFGLSFLASIPAMLIIPFLPLMNEDKS